MFWPEQRPPLPCPLRALWPVFRWWGVLFQRLLLWWSWWEPLSYRRYLRKWSGHLCCSWSYDCAAVGISWL